MRRFFETHRLLKGVLLVTAVIGLLYALLKTFTGGPEPIPEHPTASVVAATAVRGSLSATTLSYGSVTSSPQQTRIITMPHEGAINAVNLRVGDSVKAGQAIVSIARAPATTAQYSQARSALDFAEKELSRITRLYADKLAANDQLASARKALTDAQAQMDQFRETGADRSVDTLIAPFAGVIVALGATPGDRPPVGSMVATLAGRADMIVELGIEPADASKIAAGALVTLILPLSGASDISGQIVSVGAAVDPISRLIRGIVEIAPADVARLTFGMSVIAHINLSPRDGVIIPRSAVLEDAQGTYVYTITGGKAHRQGVQIAVETDDKALITKGVDDGASVIVSGNAALEDGVAVREATP
jgi:RND family efflux transporter MFP subunit